MPWLRKIPLINIFTAEQSALEMQSELVVYLTPYIWIPGMKKPRLIVEDLRLEHPELLSVEKFGLR
jgi:Flp pilus assembly secretin CpaC